MKPNIDWIIHGCANGVVCEIDGKTENGYMPGTCNFHTHGMSVSDVVWAEGLGTFFCDSIGYKPIKFEQKKCPWRKFDG